jgi:hypothetical protein
MKFRKINGKGGETFYHRESGVSYSWSFMSNANGSAFGRAHGSSGIFFRIKADNREVTSTRIGSARVMADARPIAREWIRDHGKAIAIAVAEAAIINKGV